MPICLATSTSEHKFKVAKDLTTESKTQFVSENLKILRNYCF